MTRMSMILCPLALAAASLAGACSTAPPPPSVAQAEQAVRTADTQNAGAHAPQAMVEARRHLADAQRAVRNDRPNTADRLAKEAIASAQYAQAQSEVATEMAGLNYVNRTGSSPILPHTGVPPQPVPTP